MIEDWQRRLGISDWKITTQRIDPENIDYNGEEYFIGIERDFSTKTGIIYHDIDLYEVAICHELLHIKYPESMFPKLSFEEYEDWIDKKSEELVKNKYKYK